MKIFTNELMLRAHFLFIAIGEVLAGESQLKDEVGNSASYSILCGEQCLHSLG